MKRFQNVSETFPKRRETFPKRFGNVSETFPKRNLPEIAGNCRKIDLAVVSRPPRDQLKLPEITGKILEKTFSRARENFVQTESPADEICSQSMFSNKIRLKIRRYRIFKDDVKMNEV